MRLDDKKDIQYAKSAWFIFNSELKACILSPLEANNEQHQWMTVCLELLLKISKQRLSKY